MTGNILIQKKLERDLGLRRDCGAHLRTNLKEILAVEHLFVIENWLEDPNVRKPVFDNLDKTSILDEDLTKFWELCGLNRDSGVSALLLNKPVSFKNVKATVDTVEMLSKISKV